MKFLSSKSSTPHSRPTISLSIGGHRNLTILIVGLTLFISICVYFVNSVVLSPSDDSDYRSQAEANAQLINFNTALLNQAQSFTANANNTTLPSGRVDPFTP